jgi:hypothetical protein
MAKRIGMALITNNYREVFRYESAYLKRQIKRQRHKKYYKKALSYS